MKKILIIFVNFYLFAQAVIEPSTQNDIIKFFAHHHVQSELSTFQEKHPEHKKNPEHKQKFDDLHKILRKNKATHLTAGFAKSNLDEIKQLLKNPETPKQIAKEIKKVLSELDLKKKS